MVILFIAYPIMEVKTYVGSIHQFMHINSCVNICLNKL